MALCKVGNMVGEVRRGHPRAAAGHRATQPAWPQPQLSSFCDFRRHPGPPGGDRLDEWRGVPRKDGRDAALGGEGT